MLGRTVSHYRIVAELGGGAMGIVYRAVDLRLGRDVALKFLPAELSRDPQAKARFHSEARSAAALDHANICPVHETGETEDGRLFICMAFCEGESLHDRLDRGPLPEGEAIGIARQVALGLARAHEAGIVHRDIKPGNIMISPRGEVRIVDFGLARLVTESTVTFPRSLAGTIAYMSPEQARGEEVTAASDVWALGVCLYQMLTGRLPFGGEHPDVVLHRILHEDPPPLPRALARRAVARVVRRCLAIDQRERFRNGGELSRALGELEWRPWRSLLEPARRGWRWLRRRPAISIPAAVLIAALALRWVFPSRPDSAVSRWLLAVLPAPECAPADVPLRDGLAWELTGRLTELETAHPDLFVVPAYFTARSGASFPGAASQKLGATRTLVLALDRLDSAGAVHRIRLTASDLSDRGGRVISRTPGPAELTGSGANLATWQVDVSRRAAELLGVSADAATRHAMEAGGTTVPAAFREYLRGLGFLSPVGRRGAALDSAGAALGRAVAADSSFARAWGALGACELEQARRDSSHLAPALRACRRALELGASESSVRVVMGRIAQQRLAGDEALSNFRRAYASRPLDPLAPYYLSRCYESRGDTALAEQVLQVSRAHHPGWGRYAYNLGTLYFNRGRYRAAILAYRDAAARMPGWDEVYAALGGAYCSADSLDEAWAAMRRALDISERQDATFWSNFGVIEFYQGRYDEAAAMYAKAKERDPEDYRYWGWLAHAQWWAGRRGEARVSCARAVQARACSRSPSCS